MATIKVKNGDPVYVLKLTQDEMVALYTGLTMDVSRYDNHGQYKLAVGIDNLLNEAVRDL